MAPNLIHSHPFIDGWEDIPKEKTEDVRTIHSWLRTQPNLPQLSDVQVYTFLHSNYYDIKNTQNTIESYFSLRTSAPDLFLNQSPIKPEIQQAFDLLYMVPLPKTTVEGYKVIIFKLLDPDPNKFVHLNTAKAMILFNDCRLSEDGITPGYIVICDARGFSMSHLTKLNINILRVYLKYMQEAKPVRLKGLHVLYSAKIIDKLVTLAKPFMRSELQKMLKIHSGQDLSNFFKYVPQELMPEDYGGKAESLQVLHDRNRKLLETKYVKWVEEEEAFLLEVMKLRNQKKNSMTSSEPIGSFRNLSLD